MSLIGGPNIVRNGLVLHFDAASTRSYPGSGTTWTDLTGLRTATINGPYSYNTGNGGYFHGFEFNNSNITINNPPTSTITSGTIQCIVMYTNTQDQGYCVLGFRDNNFGEFKLGGGFSSATNNIMFLAGDNRFITALLTQNVWNFVSAVADQSNISINLSVNGGARSTNTYGSLNSLTPTTAYMVSRNPTAAYQAALNGRLAIVLYYNRALSREEELQNYNALRNRFKI
jgi:hypothetical protein